MISVKRDNDSAIGMYDTVTQTFFTNSGTVPFIAGPYLHNTLNSVLLAMLAYLV